MSWIIDFFKRLSFNQLSEADRVSVVLNHLDKSDPSKRRKNKWDEEFYKLVPVFHKYNEALDFLNTYGYVCDTYFQELKKYNPEKNLYLQMRFCETKKDGFWKRFVCKYPNLLFWYLRSWDLSMEAKTMLKRSGCWSKDVFDLYNKLAPEFNREQL